MAEKAAEAELKRIVELLASRIDPALAVAGEKRLADFLTRLKTPADGACASARPPERWQDNLIAREIPARATVLDLGCGNGELLARLIAQKQIRAQGLELEPASVMQCVAKGVPVFQADLDGGLKGFPDRRFDYVILEETLQTLHRPLELLQEMLRVGRHGIVSFPNFGYWRVRLDLAVRGRMPVTDWLPHRWYDTPNIHLFCLQDLLDWAEQTSVRLIRGFALCEGQVRPLQAGDNLQAEEALLILERGKT